MGVFQHLSLLLWKNLKLRLRAPVLTGIQLIWPLAVFIVVAVIRQENPPVSNEQCHYAAKGMPSSGLMPFMQSFMCDMQNQCQNNMTTPSNQIPAYAGAQISNILEELQPLFVNDTLLQQLRNLSYNVQPINELTSTINQGIQNLTGKEYKVRDILKDPEYVKSYLRDEAGIEEEILDVFLNATININRIFDLLAGFSFKTIACNETELTGYLEFQEDANVTNVVKSLCNITDSQIPLVVEELQQQLDVAFLLTEFSDLLNLFGKYNWDKVMNDLAILLEGVGDIQDIGQLLEDFPKLIEFIDIIPKLQELYDVFSTEFLDLESAIFKHVIDTLDEVFGNATEWVNVRKGIRQIGILSEFFNEKIDDSRDDDGQILLSDLFRNSSDFTRFVDRFFAEDPGLTEVFLQATISPDILRALLTDSEQVAATLCDPNSLEEIFHLPEDADVEYVQETLCTMNATELLDELWRMMDMTQVVKELNKYNDRSDNLFDVDWVDLYYSVKELSESLQSIPPHVLEDIPEFLDSLLRLNLDKWNQLAQGIGNTNTTLDWWMDKGTGLTVWLFEENMKNSQLWPTIQKMAILENLAVDIIMLVTGKLTGERYCPENWMKEQTSCYLPVEETMTMVDANSHCDSLVIGSHLVAVETAEEQALLESMSIGFTTWIGAKLVSSQDGDQWQWLNGESLTYENWASETQRKYCAVANFGSDGEWHKHNCSLVTEGFICESQQGPAIMNFMMDDPFVEMATTIMELGPDVMSAIMESFSDQANIEEIAIYGLNISNIFCGDFIQYPDTVNVTVVKNALCQFDIEEMMEEFMFRWDSHEIMEKVTIFQEVLDTSATDLTPEHLVYANYTALIIKSMLMVQQLTELSTYPMDWNFIFMNLFKDIDIGGITEVMQQQLTGMQTPMTLEESLSSTMLAIGQTLETMEEWRLMEPLVMYSHYMMMSMNKQFEMAEALSRGEVFSDQPEVTKLLNGIIAIMSQPTDLMVPLMTVLMDQEVMGTIDDLEALEDMFCDVDRRQELFDFPPSANVTVFDLYLCNINITILSEEFAEEFYQTQMNEQMEKFAQLMNGIDIPASGEPFDWETYMKTAQTVTENLNMWGNVTMTFVEYYDLVAVMEMLASMNMSASPFQVSPEMPIVEVFENAGMMMSQMLDGMQGLFPEMENQIKSQHLFIKMVNKHFEIMEGFAENRMEINGTELIRFYTSIYYIQTNMQSLLQTVLMMFMDPQQAQQLSQVDDWSEVVCNPDVRPIVDSSFDFSIIDDNLCQINWETLFEEMQREMFIGELIHQVDGMGSNTTAVAVDWSYSQYLEDSNKMNANIGKAVEETMMMINGMNMTSIVNKISQEIMQNLGGMTSADIPEMILPAILVSMMPTLEQTEMWNHYEPFVKTIYDMVNTLNHHLEMFSDYVDGKIDLENQDLMMFYDGVYMLLQDAPVVVDTLINTVSDPSKVAMISQITDWHVAFCDPERRSQWLTFPPNFNQSVFDDYLCEVNYDNLVAGTDQYPMNDLITKIQHIVMGTPVNVSSEPINWEAFLISMSQLAENTMTMFNRTAGMFEGHDASGMEGILLEAVEKAGGSYMEMVNSGLGMIPMTIRMYGEMMEQSEVWTIAGPMFNLANSLMEAVNRHFELWQTITEEDPMVVMGNETELFLHGIQGLMKEFPDVLQVTLETLNDQLKTNAMAAHTADELLCNDDIRSYFFEFPPTTNVSFMDDLCQVNYLRLADELKVEYRVDVLEKEMSKLQELGNGVHLNFSVSPFDWDLFIANAQSFTDNIMLLPNITMTWQTLYNWTQILRMMEMVTMQSQMQYAPDSDMWLELLVQNMGMIDGILVDNIGWNEIKRQLKMNQYVYKFTNRKMDEIMENGLTMDSLLENSTVYIELIQKSAEILPDLIDASFTIISNPQKMMEIVMAENWNDILCDSNQLKEFLDLEDASEIESVQRIFCNSSMESLMNDLVENRNIAELYEQINQLFRNDSEPVDIDWLDFFRTLVENNMKLQMFGNFSGPIFPSLPLLELFNGTFWNSRMENVLGNLPMQDSLNWLELVAGNMVMGESIMGDNAAWNEIKLNLKMYYYVYKYINGRMAEVLENGLTMDLFYENATLYTELIHKSIELLPGLIDASMSFMMQPQEMLGILQSGNWNETLCDEDQLREALNLPDTSDVGSIQRILCTSSADDFMNDLLKNRYMAELVGQLEDLYKNASESVEIDWLDFFRTFEEYVMNLERLQDFDGPIYPSLPDFITNSTFWDLKLKSILAQLDVSDTAEWMNMLMRSTDLVENMLDDNAAWNSVKTTINMYHHIYKYVNARMEDTIENGLTLELIDNATMILELIHTSAELLPNLIDASMTFITQPEKMISILMASDWNEILCDAEHLQDAFDLPDTTHVISIQQILCNSSQDDFMSDLLKNRNIAELVAQIFHLMNASQSVEVDWLDFFRTVEEYSANLERLQSLTAPIFPTLSQSLMNATVWEAKIQEMLGRLVMPETNSWNDLLAQNSELIDSLMGNNSIWNEIKGNLKTYLHFYQYANDRLDDIIENGLTLEPTFGNLTLYMEVIQQSAEQLPDLIDAFLTLISQPEKIIDLVTSSDWNETLCDPEKIRDIFGLPNTSHITSIQRILCSTSPEDLMDDVLMSRDITELLNQLGSQTNTSKPVEIDWFDFFSTLEEYATKLGQLEDFNGPLYPSLQTFSVNETFWDIKISQILRNLQMSETNDWLDVLADNMAMVENAWRNNTAWNDIKQIISLYNHVYKYVNNRLEYIIENGMTLDSLYKNTTMYAEMLLESTNQLPNLIDASMVILTQPEKVMQFISSAAINETLCHPDILKEMFDFPETAEIMMLQNLLCNANVEDIIKQLASDEDLSDILNQIGYMVGNDSSPIDVDWTSYFRTIEETAVRLGMMQNNSLSLFQSLPPFITNGTFWEDKIKEVLVMLDMPDTNIWLDLVGRNLAILDTMFGNDDAWNEVKSQAGMYYFIIKYISGRLDEAMDTGLKLDSFYLNATEYIELIQKSAEFLPDLIEASLAMGTQPEKIIQLALSEDWNTTLCDPKILKEVFNLTEDADIMSIQRILCKTSYEEIMAELLQNQDMAELIGQITHLLGNSSAPIEIDWMDFFRTMEDYALLLDVLQNYNAPLFPSLQEITINGTSWNILMARMLSRLQMPGSNDDLFQLLAENIGIVASMLPDTEPWNEIKNNIHMNYYILKYINGRLEEITENGLTLDSLYENGTMYIELFQQLADSLPDMMEASLALITQPQKLMEIIAMSVNGNETLCDPDQLKETFNFPASANVTALLSLLCESVNNDYMNDLMQIGDVAELLDQINQLLGNASGEVEIDWLDFIRTIQEYATRLEELQSINLPIFPSLLELNETLLNTVLPQILARLQMPTTTAWFEQLNTLLNVLDIMWQNNTMWNSLKSNMQMNNIIYKFVNAKLDDIMENGLSLDGLFENATLYIELMQKTAEALPDLVDLFFTVVTQPEKLSELITGDWNETLCDADDLREEFGFSANITEIQRLLCNFNTDAFMHDLLRNRDFAQLLASMEELSNPGAFSWLDYIKTLEEYAAKTMELQNLQDLPVFLSLPQSLMNGTIWNVNLQEMIARLNMPISNNYIDTMAFMLDSIDNMLIDNEEWNSVLKSFQTNNAVMEFINTKLRQVLDEGLTLDRMFKNTTFFADYIKTSVTFLPDVIQATLTMMTTPQKLVLLVMRGQLNNTLCDPQALSQAFTFPATVNLTSVSKILCFPMDGDFLLQDLLNNDEIADVMREFMESNEDSGIVDFSWQEYAANIQEYMVLLEALANFSRPVLPSLPEFLLDGSNIQEAMGAILDPINVFQGLESLSDIMIVLDNLLHDNPLWQESLKIMQITNVVVNPMNKLLKRISEDEAIMFPRIHDLLGDADEVREILNGANIVPDLTDFFMNLVVYPDKLFALLFTPEPFTTLCENGEFQTFFMAPSGTEFNLTAVERFICSVNLTVAGQEMMELIDAERIMQEITTILESPSPNINWTEWAINNGHLVDAISAFMLSPPNVVDQEWLDTAMVAFTNIFMKLGDRMTSNETMTDLYGAFQMLDDNMEMIQNSVVWKDLRPILITFNWLAEFLNKNIEDMRGSNITFGDLFPESIAEYLEKSGEFPSEMVKAIQEAAVNSDKIYALLTYQNWYEVICNNDTAFDALFGLPDNVNMSAIQYAICSVDQSVWMNELLADLKLQDLLAQLNSTDEDMPFSWTDIFMNMMELMQNLEHSMQRPVEFPENDEWIQNSMQELENVIESLANILNYDVQSFRPLVDMIWNILRSDPVSQPYPDLSLLMSMNTTSIMQQLERIASSYGEEQLRHIGNFLNQVNEQMEDVSEWKELQQYIHVLNYFVEFSIRTLHAFEDGEFTFSEILRNQSQMIVMLENSLNLSPDVAEALLSASLNPEKLFELVDPETWESFVCDGDKLVEVFDFGSSVNISEMVDALCGANFTQMAEQLAEELELDRLLMLFSSESHHRPIDWTQTILNVMEMYTLWTDMMNSNMSIPMMPVSMWENPLMQDNFTVILADLGEAFGVDMTVADPESLLSTFETLMELLIETNSTEWNELFAYADIISQVTQWLANEFDGTSGSQFNFGEGQTNITELIQSVMRMIHTLENLLSYPASLDESFDMTTVDMLMDFLQGYLNSTQLTQTPTNINELLQLVENTLKANDVWEIVRPQFELFTGFVDAIFENLGNDTDLMDLMNDPNQLLQYLQDSLLTSPEDLQQAFLMDQFNIWQLAKIYNDGAWDDIFCNLESFTNSLPMPLSPELNSTAIQQTMCNINITSFFMGAEEDLGVDILELQKWMALLFSANSTNLLEDLRPFNLEDMTGNIQQLINLFEQLQTAAPGLGDLTGVDFTEIKLILEEYMNATGNEMEMIITVIETLDPFLRNDSFWRMAKGYIESIGNLATWFNDRYDELEDFRFNLTSLISNKTQLIDSLSTLMSQETAGLLMNAAVSPENLIKLMDINTFQESVCDPEQFTELFEFPPDFDVDDIILLQQTLCDIASNETTADMLVSLLLSQFDVMLLYQEIEKLMTDNYGYGIGADDVEWRKVIDELRQAIENMEELLGKDLSLNNFNLHDMLALFPNEDYLMENFEFPELGSLGNLGVPMCNALLPMISETVAWKQETEPVMIRADHTMDVVNKYFATVPGKLHDVVNMEQNLTAMIEFTMETVIVLPDVLASAIVILTDPVKFQTWMSVMIEVYLMENETVATAVCDEAALRVAMGVPGHIDTTEIASMMCGMSRIGSTAVMEDVMRIMDIESFEEQLQYIWSAPIEELGPFNCSTFVPHVMESIATTTVGLEMIMNGTIARIFSDLQIVDMIPIISDLLTVVTPSDLERIANLMQYLEPFLDDETLAVLENMDVVQPYIGLIQGWIEDLMLNYTKPGPPINFTEIFTNSSEVQKYLTDIMGIDAEFVRLLMNSTVNSDMLLQIIETEADVLPIICDEDQVHNFIMFPPDANETMVMFGLNQLCTVNVPLDVLENFVDTPSLVAKLLVRSPPSENPDWSTLMGDLERYLKELRPSEEFLDRAVKMWEDLSGALEEGIDAAQLLLINDQQTGDIIIEMGELLVTFEPFLHDLPEYQRLREFFDAFESLPVLREILQQMPDVQISELVINADDFKDFLVEELNFPPKVADDLLRASLKFESFFDPNATVVADQVCNEEELSQLLVFPEDFNVTDLINSICTVEQNLWANITSELISQLNIGTIIQQILSGNIQEQIEGVADNLDGITELLDTLKPLEEKLPEILNAVKNFSLTDKLPPEIGQGTLTGTAARQAMSSMSEVMCGEDLVTTYDDVESTFTAFGKRRKRDVEPRGDQIPSELLEAKTDFCRSVYQQINNGPNGIITWAYLKPILLGKIPYAPDNEATRKIIAKANDTFQEVADLQTFATTWLETSETIGEGFISAEEINQLRETLSNPLVSSLLEGQENLDTTQLLNALDSDLASLLGGEGTSEMDSLLKLLWEVTQCVELDRFEGFATEEEMVARAKELDLDNKMLASVFFSEFENRETLPRHVKYKIRMDIDNTPQTHLVRPRVWRPAPRTDFINDQRYLRGFVYLQDMVERAVINVQTGRDTSDVGLYTQQVPYPCYVSDMFTRYTAYMLPVLLTLSFIANVAIMTYRLVYEKEHGLEEVMKVMGLPSGVNWCAWFLNNFILLAISAILLVVILKVGNVLGFSDWLVLIVFLLCYCFSLVMMCYMIGAFFQRSNMSSVAAILVYLVGYLPYVVVLALQDELNFWQSILTCLSSTTALCYGCGLLAIYEEQGIGIHWSNIQDNPIEGGVLTFDWMLAMIMIDSVIYFLIGWYVNNVNPGRYGIPRPFYFPLTLSYWNCCPGLFSGGSRKKKYTEGTEIQGHSNPTYETGYLDEEDGRPGVERAPVGLHLGVSIEELTKKYGSGKRRRAAVNNLSLNFYEGQITSFLGHNGAGKTTTISIMTGTIPPSSGTVYHHGKNVVKHVKEVRQDLGMCPQHNALFETLTVDEHLQLYGRIKGFPRSVIKQRAYTILEDVGLLEHRNQKVQNLSGGMKRKLSVAIAFFAGSRTVILDEPTSGIDPMARRGIWDLILKNRQDRTIILCTHHMDEADFLGDRIAILDRGQLRACGSPLFLKRRFGDGYKLTLSKTDSQKSTPEKERKETKQSRGFNLYEGLDDEKDVPSSSGSTSGASSMGPFDTNIVTEFIQSRIQGAELIEDIGSELSYTLPITRGQLSNFGGLFADLDDHLPSLRLAAYGISNTTLEQIFLKLSGNQNIEVAETALTAQESESVQRENWNLRRSHDDNSDISYVSTDTEGDKDSKAKRRKRGEEGKLRGDSEQEYVGLALGFKQLSAILIKRFHHVKRDIRGYFWTLIMPAILIALSLFFADLEISGKAPALQLTPAMFGSPSYVFYSNSQQGQPQADQLTASFLGPPGIGTTCMADADQKNLYPCSFKEDYFDINIADLTYSQIQTLLEQDRNVPNCTCSNQGRQRCPDGAAGSRVPEWRSNTSSIIQDLTLKPDLSDYLQRTTAEYFRVRYGGLSFGNTQSGSSKQFIKVWYDNEGFHTMPTFLNTMNNVLLRSRVQQNGENPALYGITAYNHPLHLNKAQLGDDTVLEMIREFGVCIMIVCAFCIVPPCFIMYLVTENIRGIKRLHLVSGMTLGTYWLANFLWDMINYLLPTALCVILVYAFGTKSFSSPDNIPAFVSLLLLFGWSCIPFMYLFHRSFKDSGTAFIVCGCANALIAILTNIFSILPMTTEELLEVKETCEYVFLMFPQFCLTNGLIRLSSNQHIADVYMRFGVNVFEEPLGYEMLGWHLIVMAAEGVLFFLMVLIFEYISYSVPDSHNAGKHSDTEQEDSDVMDEQRRVLAGNANKNFVVLQDLTKVYRTGFHKHVAVNHLSLGVPGGECFGLLGVNGAGKTTTFKMLTGDLNPSGGKAILNSTSTGYCPQEDALDNLMTGREHLYCYARIRGIPGKNVKTVVKWALKKVKLLGAADKRVGKYSGGMKRKLSTAISLIGKPDVILMDEPTTGMDPTSRRVVWDNILSTIADRRSVVFTSHSMEECEALCTRLAIMVNGRFKCLGSPQHVKNKYGQGYTLILKVGREMPNLRPIEDLVVTRFPSATLQERHHGVLHYQIPGKDGTLSMIFKLMEDKKKTFHIEDYSVFQTTLDQVYVTMGKRPDTHSGVENEAFEDAAVQVDMD